MASLGSNSSAADSRTLLLAADVADVGDGTVVIRGSVSSIRLAGKGVSAFALKLAQVADATRSSFEVLASLSGFDPDAVDRWLSELVAAGLLVDVPTSREGHKKRAHVALASLGAGSEAIDRLARATVAVIGLDDLTVGVATCLAHHGIGSVLLVVDPASPEQSSNRIGSLGQHCNIITREADSLEQLTAATAGSDFLFGSLSPRLLARAHWANRSALATQVPAIFGHVHGKLGYAGPLVFPGEGPCMLCYRMRALACEDDFLAAMALEEKRPHAGAGGTPSLPAVVDAVASVLAMEVVKAMTGLAAPTLVGAVLELDGIDHSRRVHRVLQRPDCPACRKKGLPPRPPRIGGDLNAVGLVQLHDLIVSPHCGIIRTLEPVPCDVTEPAIPLVVRAEVSNNRFHSADNHPFQPCSGKGVDLNTAFVSALGEACERYGATTWRHSTVRRCRLDELESDVIAPSDLVLFAEDQYADLPFTRWDPAATIGWVTGIDAATQIATAVPAVEALLGYEGTPADHLYASTSNGLAAGRSLAQAALSAALEVIERDAFLISWFHRLPGSRIDPATVEHASVRSLTDAYRRRDVSLELYRLPTDLVEVSVYAAIGVQCGDRAVGPGPAAVVGLGAALDDRAAALKAVLEVGQIRPALKARLRDPASRERAAILLADPTAVEHLDDHDLVYSEPGALEWLSFWRDGEPQEWMDPGSVPENDQGLPVLLEAITSRGHRLVICDLTPPELGALGVHVARAVIPGFQPIHFGSRQARLAGSRLYELPYKLDLRAAPASRSDLNRLPHPIS